MAWTLAELEAEIGRYNVSWGAFEHTGTSLYALIGRKLREFTSYTHCLYGEEITVTTTAATIDLTTTTFTTPASTTVLMETISGVRIEDVGKLDMIDVATLEGYFRGYQDADTGSPAYWAMDAHNTLRFYPQPVASTTFKVRGFYYHPAITSASASSATVNLPPDCEPAFIDYLVASVMETNASQVTLQQQQNRMQMAMSKMTRLRQKYNPSPEWSGFFIGTNKVVNLGV